MNITSNIKNKMSVDTLLDLLVMIGVSLFLFSFFIQVMAGIFLFLSSHIDWAKHVFPAYAEFSLRIFRFGEDFRIYSVIFAGMAFMILSIKKNYN